MRIGNLAKRTIAVDMPGIEKGLKTGRVGGGYIKGKEIDAPVVKDAEKIAKAVKGVIKPEGRRLWSRCSTRQEADCPSPDRQTGCRC
jgi:methyl coenzyme M reductase beta subunit